MKQLLSDVGERAEQAALAEESEQGTPERREEASTSWRQGSSQQSAVT